MKKFYPSIFIVYMLFSVSVLSQPNSLNKIGCVIINDAYLENQPSLMKAPPVALDADTTKKELIYKNKVLTVKAAAATVTEVALSRPWISSFKLSVSRIGHDTITVRSSPRNGDTEEMNTYLVITSAANEGELIISCSTYE